eukprot:3170874-Rhodomonas_salina.5
MSGGQALVRRRTPVGCFPDRALLRALTDWVVLRSSSTGTTVPTSRPPKAGNLRYRLGHVAPALLSSVTSSTGTGIAYRLHDTRY